MNFNLILWCVFLIILISFLLSMGWLACKEPWMVEIPCKDRTKPNQKSTMRVPVILPHELLHWLGQNKRFHIHQSLIKKFWERWEQFRPFHPASTTAIHNPIGITGDDAKYTLGGSKAICIAMNLILLDRMKTQSNDLTTSTLVIVHSIFSFTFSFGLVEFLFSLTPQTLKWSIIFWGSSWLTQGLDTNRLLLATLRVECSLGHESLGPIWRLIAWSLNAT